MPRTMPGSPSRIMHQSNPGVRRRLDSQPSIHFPRGVYLSSMKMGAADFSKFSFGAKNSSLATSTAPPSLSEARSISSVNFIRPANLRDRKQRWYSQWSIAGYETIQRGYE